MIQVYLIWAITATVYALHLFVKNKRTQSKNKSLEKELDHESKIAEYNGGEALSWSKKYYDANAVIKNLHDTIKTQRIEFSEEIDRLKNDQKHKNDSLGWRNKFEALRKRHISQSTELLKLRKDLRVAAGWNVRYRKEIVTLKNKKS